MNDAILNSVVDKLDEQGKKITVHEEEIRAMKEKSESQPDYQDFSVLMEKRMVNIEMAMSKLSFPENEISELSFLLANSIALTKNPVQNKTIHHHHIAKITWISACLFLAFSLVCSGWYMTTEKLDQFKTNDTKYRNLKLDTSNIFLRRILYHADSLYRVLPNFREVVIQEEDEMFRNQIGRAHV